MLVKKLIQKMEEPATLCVRLVREELKQVCAAVCVCVCVLCVRLDGARQGGAQAGVCERGCVCVRGFVCVSRCVRASEAYPPTSSTSM